MQLHSRAVATIGDRGASERSPAVTDRSYSGVTTDRSYSGVTTDRSLSGAATAAL